MSHSIILEFELFICAGGDTRPVVVVLGRASFWPKNLLVKSHGDRL